MSSSKEQTPLRALVQRLPVFSAVVLAFLTGDDVFPLPIIIIVVSLYYLTAGLVRKDIKGPKAIITQASIALGFVALGVVTLIASGPLSFYIMAAAWLLHAVWDLHLYRKNIMAPRWLTEFCIFYDTLLAVLLIIAGTKL